MSAASGWTPPPPPPRRYAPKWVWLGLVGGGLATIALPPSAFLVLAVVDYRPLATAVFVVGLLTPLVVGIVLTVKPGTATRRSLGLGIIIGWALAPIVFAGVCTVIVLTSYRIAG